MRAQHTYKGFTLIEMMIVVALIAILAGIALPAYNNYVNRSKIKIAQSDLVALSLNYANEYQRTFAYPAADVDLSTTAKLKERYKGWSPASKDFDFKTDSTVANKTTYKILAVGKSTSGVAGCEISINQLNDRAISSCSYSSSGDWL